MNIKTHLIDIVFRMCYPEKLSEARYMRFYRNQNKPLKTLRKCLEQPVFHVCVEKLTDILPRLIFDTFMFINLWKSCEIPENKGPFALPEYVRNSS